MKTAIGPYLALVLFISCVSIAQAEMFKCIDNDGKTKYQASKCSQEAKTSTVKPADVPVTLEFLAAQGEKIDRAFYDVVRSTSEQYAHDIAKLRKLNLPTEPLETEKKLALKNIYIEYEKALKKYIVDLKIHGAQPSSGEKRSSYSGANYLALNSEQKLKGVQRMLNEVK